MKYVGVASSGPNFIEPTVTSNIEL